MGAAWFGPVCAWSRSPLRVYSVASTPLQIAYSLSWLTEWFALRLSRHRRIPETDKDFSERIGIRMRKCNVSHAMWIFVVWSCCAMEPVRSYTLRLLDRAGVWDSLTITRYWKNLFNCKKVFSACSTLCSYSGRAQVWCSSTLCYEKVPGVSKVGGVGNMSRAYAKTSHNEYPLATLGLARHTPRPVRIRYLKPHPPTSNQHH